MLISPILTVMSVYRLKGGQLLSRGYVAKFFFKKIEVLDLSKKYTIETCCKNYSDLTLTLNLAS